MFGNPVLIGGEPTIVIVMPVYRDWKSASSLCRALDVQLAGLSEAAIHILLVDDGTPEGFDGWEAAFTPERIHSVQVLSLRRNLGHQRAIACGLCHVYQHMKSDYVLVMDADGEDRPGDAIRLIRRAMQNGQIVFAKRRKRLEGLTFRAGYFLYRVVHRILTGVPVRVGNFSAIPASALARLVCMTETWNHYAGAVFKSKLCYATIATDRGTRYHGTSQMNLVALVSHGLAGIASFYDTVATRILIASLTAMGVVAAATLVVVWIRAFTTLAIPGWATVVAGVLLVILVQLVAISFNLVFTLIASRGNLSVVPLRDCGFFIDGVTALWVAADERRRSARV